MSEVVANPVRGGEVIRDRRTALEVTTSDLAQACQKTPTHISEIEHGRRTPSPELLECICDRLDITGQSRLDVFVLFAQMPTEVERYIQVNRPQVIASVQRMISRARAEGTWPPRRRAAKSSAAKASPAAKAKGKPKGATSRAANRK